MRRAGQRGFTLVEMMVSLALLAIVTAVMASTFLVGYTTITNEARTIAADTAVSQASLFLLRDLSTANTVVTGLVSGASSVSFTYGSPAVTVTYTLDANQDLVRTAGGTSAVAGRGITSVGITASGCYETVTIQPSAAGAAVSTLNVSNRPGGCF